LGQGLIGKTYAVWKPIAKYVAVVKIIQGNVEYDKRQAIQEAQNLCTVEQLLGWGAEIKEDEDVYDRKWYFVMKNMGVSQATAERAGMRKGAALGLIEEAKKRYEAQFQMKHS
jgi:hypothetical protein